MPFSNPPSPHFHLLEVTFFLSDWVLQTAGHLPSCLNARTVVERELHLHLPPRPSVSRLSCGLSQRQYLAMTHSFCRSSARRRWELLLQIYCVPERHLVDMTKIKLVKTSRMRITGSQTRAALYRRRNTNRYILSYHTSGALHSDICLHNILCGAALSLHHKGRGLAL